MWQDFKDLISGTLGAIGMLVWVCFVCFVLACIGVGIYYAFESTLTPEQKEANHQADITERTPHVYSKVDNCTVYIWRNGSYNSYFTKCDNTNKVVTEFSHSENCGKACTKKVTDKVETN